MFYFFLSLGELQYFWFNQLSPFYHLYFQCHGLSLSIIYSGTPSSFMSHLPSLFMPMSSPSLSSSGYISSLLKGSYLNISKACYYPVTFYSNIISNTQFFGCIYVPWPIPFSFLIYKTLHGLIFGNRETTYLHALLSMGNMNNKYTVTNH